MKLRTQIFLFLFLFGLVPTLTAVMLNVPLVFERIESLYHKAHLQNLRAGFGELDQHLARRHEMVRLLAKFPEPGMLPSDADRQSSGTIDTARRGYVEWINQVLFDQLDIIRILFIDDAGQLRYLLERNNATGRLEPVTDHKGLPNRELIEAGLKLNPGAVLTGPIVFNPEAGEAAPNKFMLLGLVSPVVTASVPENEISSVPQGVVVADLIWGGSRLPTGACTGHIMTGVTWVYLATARMYRRHLRIFPGCRIFSPRVSWDSGNTRGSRFSGYRCS